jgi:hypothetical protein
MKTIVSLLMIILVSIGSNAVAKEKSRKFYLTQDEFTGNQALTACANGYHMASFWEIFDFSDLKYDTALGFTEGDSGFGPPCCVMGLVRTGGGPTFGNCLEWTSDDPNINGRVVGLPTEIDWVYGEVLIMSPWQRSLVLCNTPTRVWCVRD